MNYKSSACHGVLSVNHQDATLHTLANHLTVWESPSLESQAPVKLWEHSTAWLCSQNESQSNAPQSRYSQKINLAVTWWSECCV